MNRIYALAVRSFVSIMSNRNGGVRRHNSLGGPGRCTKSTCCRSAHNVDKPQWRASKGGAQLKVVEDQGQHEKLCKGTFIQRHSREFSVSKTDAV